MQQIEGKHAYPPSPSYAHAPSPSSTHSLSAPVPTTAASSSTHIDATRSGRVALYRAVHAPVIDASWRAFDARFLARGGMLAAGLPGAAARALCDQCVLAPPSISAFFLTQGLMEGLTLAECSQRIRTSFLPTYSVAFPFWMTTHMITFGFVPPNWRILWASVIAVFWNAFMSGQNQRARRIEAAYEET